MTAHGPYPSIPSLFLCLLKCLFTLLLYLLPPPSLVAYDRSLSFSVYKKTLPHTSPLTLFLLTLNLAIQYLPFTSWVKDSDCIPYICFPWYYRYLHLPGLSQPLTLQRKQSSNLFNVLSYIAIGFETESIPHRNYIETWRDHTRKILWRRSCQPV